VVTSSVGELAVADFDNHAAIRTGGDFEIMGVRHRTLPIQGIQFHPESFATEGGKDILANFLFQR
jgi:anthranilate synthase component 2